MTEFRLGRFNLVGYRSDGSKEVVCSGVHSEEEAQKLVEALMPHPEFLFFVLVPWDPQPTIEAFQAEEERQAGASELEVDENNPNAPSED